MNNEENTKTQDDGYQEIDVSNPEPEKINSQDTEDSAKAELLRLHRSKSWIRKEIDRWNIEFETREGRKATKEEKAQVEEKYVAYKAIKSRMSSLAQQIIHLN